MKEPQAAVRRIYWVASSSNEAARLRIKNLGRHGFEVQLFRDVQGFKAQVAQVRPAIVVVCQDDDKKWTFDTIQAISTMPEIRSAKMILVGSTFNEEISALAACFNFRDLIPLDGDAIDTPDPMSFTAQSFIDPWTQRFIFATSGRPKAYNPPFGQITTTLPTTVGMPARISWLTQNRMCLESRARPPVGTEIKVQGALAAWYGLEYITGILESSSSQMLRYHFSESHMISWRPPLGEEEKTRELMAQFQKASKFPRYRVYVAIQDPALRNLVLKELAGGPYEIAAALKKQAIAEEPQFFTPDLVILENKLANRQHLQILSALLGSLEEHAGILILGGDSLVDQLKILYPSRQFLDIPEITPTSLPPNLSRALSRLLNNSASDKFSPKNAHHLPYGHPLSAAEIQIPASISKLHPTALQLCLSFPIARYALIRVNHSFLKETLGRNPYAKVTACLTSLNTPDEPKFSHPIDCYLADVNAAEMSTLATGVWRMFTKGLLKYTNQKDAMELSLLSKLSPIASLVSSSFETPDSAANGLTGATETLNTATAQSTPATVEGKSSGADLASAQTTSQRSAKRLSPTKQEAGTPRQAMKDLIKSSAVILISLICLWLLYTWLAPRMIPSGSVYSDQLKKFAPHRSGERDQTTLP